MQDMTFVHLSDTHIGPKGRLQYGTDTAANLRQVASRIHEMALDPICFVISGDLSDHGEPASYEHLRELFDAVLVPFGVRAGGWEGADLCLTVGDTRWEGLGAGHGHLRARLAEVPR